MRYLKKITIVALTFIFAFLIVGNSVNASGHIPNYWTLESDGYYYYNKSIGFEEDTTTQYYFETHNGNPIEVIKDDDVIPYGQFISYKSMLETRFINDEVMRYITISYTDSRDEADPTRSSLLFDLSNDLTLTLESEVPLTIRYNSKVYDRNNPGNLNLPGDTNYNFIAVTEEEYNSKPVYNQKEMIVHHDYPKVDLADSTFIKYLLKNYYYDAWETYPGYNHDNTIYKVVKLGQYHLNVDVPEGVTPAIPDTEAFETRYYKVMRETPLRIYSYSELPDTYGNLDNGLNGVADVFVTPASEGYELQVNYLNNVYLLNVDTLPEYLINSNKVYYFTDNKFQNYQFLVGFYDNEVKWTATSDFHTNLMENSYIIWNVNTGEFMMSEINFVPARIGDTGALWEKGKIRGNRLYADIIIPHAIDDLLAISVTYKYQYHYLNGSKGAWVTVPEQILLKDDYSPGYPPWWSDFFLVAHNKANHLVEEITEITMTNSFKHDYLIWLNESIAEEGASYNLPVKVYTQSEVFPIGSKAYSLYLGTFSKFWSTGVGAKDFTILQYRYEYKGVEYSNPYPTTLAPEYTPPNRGIKAPDWWTKFIGDVWAFVLKYTAYLIPVLALVSYPVIFKGFQGVFGRKINKRRTLGFFIYVALLYLIWFTLKMR